MGIYISGLELPQEGRITLQIDSNGGVYVVNKFSITSEKYEKSMPATEIQSHGRLIDADKLIDGLKECREAANDNWEYEMAVGYSNSIEEAEEAPTVIEAED